MDRDSSDESEMRGARERILDAASRLVAEGGVAALTTRNIAAAASVQAPTLYRLFGDKRGLLNAVADHGLTAFIAGKIAAIPHPDPLEDLRQAWDAYVAFGLANPAVFAIMTALGASEPPTAAALTGLQVLRTRVHRIALAGHLRVPEDRAVALIHAVGVGAVSSLLSVQESDRDPQLSLTARDAVLAAITTSTEPREDQDIAALAIGLRARLDEVTQLSPGERLLLNEILERLSGQR